MSVYPGTEAFSMRRTLIVALLLLNARLCADSVPANAASDRRPDNPAGRSERTEPPYVDYCEMLSQEVQGKKHAFMAGNLTYYVGGFYACWTKEEDETIGLTHPFFHDLRSRGHGMVKHPGSGYGHDFQGWEFYKHTKVAYGTVIVAGKQYEHPVPSKMYWRPDRMICEYDVAGVSIREEKFICRNDVVCSIIESDSPVVIRFDGHSFAMPDKSRTSTATIRYDRANNAIHIVEGGSIEVKPVEDEYHTGRLMYAGMSTVISASKDFGGSYSTRGDGMGRQVYSFEVSCDSEGVSLTWAMNDNYTEAIRQTTQVLADPASELARKTQYMNGLLNYQIPYFRCSDHDIVKVYYYLWSIYLMYYIDVDKGWEKYPHTQTAVNNFLGLHRYDSDFQIKVGSWIADKEYFAYGNVLLWKSLLPYARTGGALPDNMGIAWYSPVWGATTEHVVGAWQIYQHTGDVDFLRECYKDYYKPLFWDGMLGHWGVHYDAAECLRKMASLTGHPQDVDHWRKVVNTRHRDAWLNNMWQANGVKDFFGAGKGTLDWSGFAYLRNSYFPEDWAARMVEAWAVDTVKGFFGEVPLTTKALKNWDQVSGVFASTPDTNYYSIIGMYKRQVGRNANLCGLAHLKKYNMYWGIPIAPESWDKTPEPWGDQYSNFNAGKILIVIEGMGGLEYSVPDSSFTVSDYMPEQWSFMQWRVPIKINGKTYWPKVDVTREEDGRTVKKTISIMNNPMTSLYIRPWLEEGTVLSAVPAFSAEDQGRNRLDYTFRKTSTQSVTIDIQK